MLIKAFNRPLIENSEFTRLTVAASAGDTSLTVASTDLAPAGTSSNTWTDNNYMIVGGIGPENAEVMQINGAVTSATSLTVDREGQAGGLRYNHSVDEPVYRVDFNRVEFSQNSTDTTTGASVLTTIRLQPDSETTNYEDTANTTGYGFVRFNNETNGAFSSYSDGVNYEISGASSSRDHRALFSMRKKVRQLLDELSPHSQITDEMITDALNDKQRDIGHQRLWSFYEGERSFAGVADQFAYTLPSTVQKVYEVAYDTQPLAYMNYTKWRQLHWDSDTESADPSHFSIWNGQILVWPRPSGASSTTTISGAHNATTTTFTVAATSAFNRGDYYRFIIDSEVIYATASTSTTFTGCLRGREGTTAASHSDGATVTERDLVYTCHLAPTDLFDISDRTSIPEPDVLMYGSAIDLAPIVNKEDRIDRFERKYTNKMKELESKFALKQTGQFGRIKNATEFVRDSAILRNPNLFPRSVTGS